MKATRRTLRLILLPLFVAVVIVYALNTSHLADPVGDRPVLLAHRALGQGFHLEGLTGATCTAARMLPPEHDYLENTIPAMDAAFAYGADVVELDIHRTTDDRFAVFHDWTLDCRTDGCGVTREHTLAELQALDIGHGYTADEGESWPFRGRAGGLMPSLREVLDTFPDKTFLIDVKSNNPEDGAILAERIVEASSRRTGGVWVTGGARPVEEVRTRLPDSLTISRPRLKRCLTRYMALGWSGHVPSECRRSVLLVPANVAPWLWGWPNRFLQRMQEADSQVFLLGDYHGEGFSTAFDPIRLDRLPRGYSGGIWTDRIDVIGPAVRSRRH